MFSWIVVSFACSYNILFSFNMNVAKKQLNYLDNLLHNTKSYFFEEKWGFYVYSVAKFGKKMILCMFSLSLTKT